VLLERIALVTFPLRCTTKGSSIRVSDEDDTFDVTMATGHAWECASHDYSIGVGEWLGSGCDRKSAELPEVGKGMSHAKMHHLFDSSIGGLDGTGGEQTSRWRHYLLEASMDCSKGHRFVHGHNYIVH